MMRISGGRGAVAAGSAVGVTAALAVAMLAGCGQGKGRVVRTAQAAPEQVSAVAMAGTSAGTPGASAAKSGTSAAAVGAGSRVVGGEASPSNVTYGDAERVYRSGEYAEAADLFEAYATRRPDNPWGHYMAGIAAWKAGDHVRAEAALRRTLQVAPTHEKALLNLARVLLEEGKASDALDPAERVVALDSSSGQAWRVLGNARSDLGMVDEAVSAYRRALVLDHRDAWTMNNLGLLMIREGRYEDALPPLARATDLRPEVAVFENNLGVALERCGHPAEAADAYRAALDAEPDYARAQLSLDRVGTRSGDAVSPPLDLAALSSSFADQVTAWRQQEQAGVQPGDTTARVRPAGETPPAQADTITPARPTDTKVPGQPGH